MHPIKGCIHAISIYMNARMHLYMCTCAFILLLYTHACLCIGFTGAVCARVLRQAEAVPIRNYRQHSHHQRICKWSYIRRASIDPCTLIICRFEFEWHLCTIHLHARDWSTSITHTRRSSNMARIYIYIHVYVHKVSSTCTVYMFIIYEFGVYVRACVWL